MNGPQHYREAERLLDAARDRDGFIAEDPTTTNALAAAQVHATLALAAAAYDGLAETGGSVGFGTEDERRVWCAQHGHEVTPDAACPGCVAAEAMRRRRAENIAQLTYERHLAPGAAGGGA